MFQRSQIREGMTVRSIDGEKLGKVFAVQDGEFLIEKGLFFPKDYVCRYSEISDIRDDEVILTHGKEGLHRFSLDEDRGVLAGTGGGAGVGPGSVGMSASSQQGPVVPLRAEEEEAQKRPVVDEEVPRKLDMSPEDPNLRRS